MQDFLRQQLCKAVDTTIAHTGKQLHGQRLIITYILKFIFNNLFILIS